MDESCLIALSLQGVKSAAPDANSVEVSELAEVSKKFSRDHLHQRDVEIEIRKADKRGNFFGHLWVKDQLYAVDLIMASLGYIDARENDIVPEMDELEAAQNKVVLGKEGIWAKEVALQLGIYEDDEEYKEEDDEGPFVGQIVEMKDATSFFV